MTDLVPNRALLDLEFPLHYRSSPPAIDGQLKGWTDEELLPAFSLLEDVEPFAPVWACWNESGLFVASRVDRKRLPLRCDPRQFWKGDNLRLCIDTRDNRQARRANKYCHQLYLLPTGGGPKKNQPIAGIGKMYGAQQQPRLETVRPEFAGQNVQVTIAHPSSDGRTKSDLTIAATLTAHSYQLEAFIPGRRLFGYDPTDHPRIGLFYMLEDGDFGQQFLTVGDDLNWHIDPSTWPTAVLADK